MSRRPQAAGQHWTACPVAGNVQRVRDLPGLVNLLPTPFTAADARAVGLTRPVLARGVRSGALVRPAHGVYCPEPVWRCAGRAERHRLLTDVVLRTTAGAVASHHSAALLLGLPAPASLPSWVSITRQEGHPTSRPGSVARWHDGRLPASQVLTLADRRVCAPARIVLDSMRELGSLGDAVAIGDGALRRGLTSAEELHAMRRWQRHWPGVARADHGLALLDPRRETWLESWSFTVLWERGVELPEPQVAVYDSRGRFIGRVDGLWRDGGTVAEADGEEKYLAAVHAEGVSGEQAARRVLQEKQREDRLRDCGLEVVRWGYRELCQDPEGVVERVRAARARGDLRRFRGALRPSPWDRWPSARPGARNVAEPA